jgi:hypothetical protein
LPVEDTFPNWQAPGYERRELLLGDSELAAQSTIVFADMNLAGQQSPSAVADSFARAAKDSLLAGQFDLELKALSADDILRSIRNFPSGHERLSPDTTLVLLDAGAMLAYAPYVDTILLSSDPFEQIDALLQSLDLDADLARVRLYDALLAAKKVITLDFATFSGTAALLRTDMDKRMTPSTALRGTGDSILIVGNGDADELRDIQSLLTAAFPEHSFVAFDPSSVFDRDWKLVIHLGIAQSGFPGARLGDAWAGGVAIVQLINPDHLPAQQRRHNERLSDVLVEHGKTGLLCSTIDELKSRLGDLLVDILPAHVLARGTRRRANPAGEWDVLLKAVLQ